MAIDAKQVKELRDNTGLPMMECKRALEEAKGDQAKAKDILRKSGLKVADKKAHRETSEGLVGSYIHHDGKVGVLCEVNCETDFVARNEDFQEYVKLLCMHIAFADPTCVRRDELDPDLVAKEKEIAAESLKKVPEAKREKAIEGKLAKSLYAEKVLLDQPFAHPKFEGKTVGAALKDLIAKLRENITIRRFHRMKIGE
ncbi:MAG: translation elongation factor Ts [Planctomycetota bacterium]